MKTHPLSPTIAFSPSFALISVLALVSLAALTATAFLASARLERQATMPLTQTTMLEMALNTGVNAAKEMLDYAPSKHFNFVTTYWRGANNNDWTNELGYLLSGAVQLTNNQTSCIVNYYCCFSTSKMTNLGTSANELIVISNNVTDQGSFFSQMSSFMATQTNFLAGQSTNIPLLGDTPSNRHTSPPVGWVYIKQNVRVKPGSTNTTNVPVARFAFFVQDLCGMIDAERMGGLTNNTPYRDSTALPAGYNLGTNPAEISLTNLTDTVLTNADKVSNLVSPNNRMKYLSPGMLVLTNGGGLNTNDLRYVTTGLRHWTNAYERIPIGLGYPRSWEIKTQLKDVNFTNLVLTTPSGPSPSTAIPTTNTNFILFISNNLSQFAARSGGMNTNRYLAALGANANDFIDTDIVPTTNGAGNTAVCGIEPLPLVTETVTSVWWFNHGLNIEPYVGKLVDEIRVENFVELWNPSDRTFNGTIRICFSNNYSCGPVTWVGGSLVGGLDLTKKSSATRTVTNSLGNTVAVNDINPLTVNLAPNQYGVYSLGTNIHKFVIANTSVDPTYSSGGAFSKQSAKLSLERPNQAGQDIFDSKIQLYTGNTLYFQATNLMRQTRSLGCNLQGSPAVFGGSLPALRMTYNAGQASSPAMPGDPRIAFYLTCTNASTGYAWNGNKPGATLGYRNYAWSQVAPATEYNASPTLWMDGGHANSPVGPPLGVTAITQPTLGVQPATSDYIQTFNNTGTWSNIFELGRIFDPMAWNVPVNSPCVTSAHSAAGDGGTVLTNGGGTTLRIGRAEHQRFAWTNQGGVALDTPNMQMSSAALLDMFCVTNQFDESGQINLNTAPAPVLRALAGGILLKKDPALINNLNGIAASHPVPPGMAEAFAQGVMRFRAKYPFYSPSQLAFIGTDPVWPNTTTWPVNAVFGNTNNIALNKAPGNTFGGSTRINVNEWNDEAAEEWFAKIYKLSTTYSRNYRVYVIAQKATNQGNNLIGVGPVVRKYYNVCTRQNTDSITDVPAASTSTLNTYEAPY